MSDVQQPAATSMQRYPDNSQGEFTNLTHMDISVFRPPAWALASFEDAIRSGRNPYGHPQGDHAIRTLLAERLRTATWFPDLQAENLLFTCGAQGGLHSVLAAQTEPGDRVLLVDPDFHRYEQLCDHLELQVVRWQYDGGEDPTGLLRAVDETCAS